MKIAVVTDDRHNVAQHFGRAPYYLVYNVEGDHILEREIRHKIGHHTVMAATAPGQGYQQHERPHDRDGGHSQLHGHQRQHGASGDNRLRVGRQSGDPERHRGMVSAIEDCQMLIVGGMGSGARQAMLDAGIRPCRTDLEDADEAVRAYLAGQHMGEPNCADRP